VSITASCGHILCIEQSYGSCCVYTKCCIITCLRWWYACSCDSGWCLYFLIKSITFRQSSLKDLSYSMTRRPSDEWHLWLRRWLWRVDFVTNWPCDELSNKNATNWLLSRARTKEQNKTWEYWLIIRHQCDPLRFLVPYYPVQNFYLVKRKQNYKCL